jgi:hypothetical protein
MSLVEIIQKIISYLNKRSAEPGIKLWSSLPPVAMFMFVPRNLAAQVVRCKKSSICMRLRYHRDLQHKSGIKLSAPLRQNHAVDFFY